MRSRIDAPVLHVMHAWLRRASGDSAYKSVCPFCGGVLLVSRDQRTQTLVRDDHCIQCGQSFFYVDDEIANERLPASRTGKS